MAGQYHERLDVLHGSATETVRILKDARLACDFQDSDKHPI